MDLGKMNSLLTMSSSINKLNSISSSNTKVSTHMDTLKAEIALDKKRGLDTSSKEASLEDLSERQASMQEMIGNELGEVNAKIENDRAEPAEELTDTQGTDSEKEAESAQPTPEEDEAYSVDIKLPGVANGKGSGKPTAKAEKVNVSV